MESWRYFGTNYYYVSKSGSDAAGTTGTPTDPFLTIAAAISFLELLSGNASYSLVVGAGYYQEDIELTRPAKWFTLIADGNVILAALSTGGQLVRGTANNVHFSVNDFQLEDIGDLSNGIVFFTFSNCILRNCVVDDILSVSKCIFFSCSIYPSLVPIIKSTFVSCDIGQAGLSSSFSLLTDCCFDGNCHLIQLIIADSGIMDHNWYDFAGGTTVELQDGGSLITYNSLSGLQGAVGYWNQNSLDTAAPDFNAPAREDYTLAFGSPLAYAGSDGKQIGAFETGFPHGNTTGQAFHSGASGFSKSANVTSSGTGWEIDPNIITPAVGTITSGYIDLGSEQTVGAVKLFAHQFHPLEVVDYDNTTDNPNRQVYELSWGPDSSNLSAFFSMEWEKRPSVNLDGLGQIIRGNGDPDFDPNTQTLIQAKILQLRVTIRNEGIEG